MNSKLFFKILIISSFMLLPMQKSIAAQENTGLASTDVLFQGLPKQLTITSPEVLVEKSAVIIRTQLGDFPVSVMFMAKDVAILQDAMRANNGSLSIDFTKTMTNVGIKDANGIPVSVNMPIKQALNAPVETMCGSAKIQLVGKLALNGKNVLYQVNFLLLESSYSPGFGDDGICFWDTYYDMFLDQSVLICHETACQTKLTPDPTFRDGTCTLNGDYCFCKWTRQLPHGWKIGGRNL